MLMFSNKLSRKDPYPKKLKKDPHPKNPLYPLS